MEIIETTNPDAQQPPRKPDNYLPWAILSTLFCCMPFGIVAIVYSARVDSEWNAGRYESAIDAAASAKKWTWVSVGIFAAAALLYVIFLVFVAVFAFFGSM